MIEALSLHNFRNIERARFSFTEHFNVIYGANGSGKTSIFEGLYFAGFGSSPFGASASDVILNGKDKAGIHAKGPAGNLSITLDKGKKKVKLDDKNVVKLSEILGVFPLTLIGPREVKIVIGTPADRRKMLNMHICQIDSVYTENLRTYDKILLRRNAALKSNYSEDMLRAIDEEIASRAVAITRRRDVFVKNIYTKCNDLYREIAVGNLELTYRPSFNDDVESFKRSLLERRQRERATGYTSIGPHRDDVEIVIDDRLAKDFASWGQSRLASIVILISMSMLLFGEKKQKPAILLDDCFAELDDEKTAKLLNESPKWGQVFIATPKKIPLPGHECSFFAFEEPGIVKEVNGWL